MIEVNSEGIPHWLRAWIWKKKVSPGFNPEELKEVKKVVEDVTRPTKSELEAVKTWNRVEEGLPEADQLIAMEVKLTETKFGFVGVAAKV